MTGDWRHAGREGIGMRGNRSIRHRQIIQDRFDKIAATYEDTIGERRHAYNHAVDEIVLGCVQSMDGPLSVLDAACGTGSRWTAMKPALPHVKLCGFDASPQMVEIANNREGSGFSDVRVCDLTNVSYPDESFDVVTCLFFPFSCLTSARDRRKAAAELNRMLRPDGLLFVDAINRWHLGEGKEFHRSWATAVGEYLWSFANPRLDAGDKLYTTRFDGSPLQGFMHGYSLNSFRRLFTRAGLTIERAYIVGYNTGRSHARHTRGNILLVCRRDRQLA